MTDLNSRESSEKPFKLYDQRMIGVATYLGGPLAAGILARQNFINSGDDEAGKNALYLGILATILLCVMLYFLPEEVVDKIPRFLIPAIYTGGTYFLIERYQGELLLAHKESQRPFYSFGRAIGIGLVCLTLFLGAIFGAFFLEPDSLDSMAYDTRMEAFYENQDKAMEVFVYLEDNAFKRASTFIQKEGIPLWEKNLVLIEELEQLEDLSPEIVEQNKLLREYCQLRIKSYKLIDRSILQDTQDYDQELFLVQERIDRIIDALNKLNEPD